ncbi:hypothetical protein BST39_27835 [Mycobacterium paraseoulense]|uniref:Uncharacterized protein n=1 Tax=Mycobacterium paraseoulense TaxID=590652 RepID=A0A1X0I262_9MYCO|nr:hypothetical protein BST39_27835 [Mycobacterium paraseoulense]
MAERRAHVQSQQQLQPSQQHRRPVPSPPRDLRPGLWVSSSAPGFCSCMRSGIAAERQTP